jgi:hypothetical protein
MKLELLDFIELDNYPSGSGIEFYDGRVYVVGDKSKDLLSLTKKWSKPQRTNLVTSEDPNAVHSNLEAMTVLQIDKKPHLLIVGSGNTAEQNKAVLLNLKNNSSKFIDLTVFFDRLRSAGISNLNLEGIAGVYDYLVFVHRGPAGEGDYLVITQADFWKNQANAMLQTVLIDFENVHPGKRTLGVSGLTYSDNHEDLFLTVYEDEAAGAGKSYIAVIENLYRKIGREKGHIKVNHLIDLSAADPGFSGYNMESVCIQSEKDHSIKLQLIADNKEGKTFLFKVWLSWE